MNLSGLIRWRWFAMESSWMDEFSNNGFLFGEDEPTDFYCPYTNGSECALLTKGWQPQELCESIECSQLKLFKRNKKHRAA